ncbi:MAG: hypothetical protein L6Q99_22100 [Planctomycetes bacterium]|nr:hypothetical protein [Planctomycetota bacterium]
MISFRKLSILHRTLTIVGVSAFLALFGAIFYMAKTAPRAAVGPKNRAGPIKEQLAAGSLDYWIGTWDASVQSHREYPKLAEADREALEWSRDVLAKALGAWIATPESRHVAVQSPLKLFVPSENERARKYGEAWIDLAGNEWRPTDGQRKKEFWIQTRVRFRGREVLLGMSFKDVPDDPRSFEFYYMISLDNGDEWLLASAATFTRSGPDVGQ